MTPRRCNVEPGFRTPDGNVGPDFRSPDGTADTAADLAVPPASVTSTMYIPWIDGAPQR